MSGGTVYIHPYEVYRPPYSCCCSNVAKRTDFVVKHEKTHGGCAVRLLFPHAVSAKFVLLLSFGLSSPFYRAILD